MYILYTYALHPTKKRIMSFTRKLEKSQKNISKYKQLTSYKKQSFSKKKKKKL